VRWTELAKSSVRKYATVQQITVINVGDKWRKEFSWFIDSTKTAQKVTLRGGSEVI
jgi:hypothetical protein